MIANGGSYRYASWWANHLLSSENDRARIVKSYGLRSENVLDMLNEMDAFAKGTRCENYFYQMNLNPRGNERLTEEQWDRVREIAEKHHGFDGQAYFVVEHVKNGRVHQHIVWSRIDLETMRAIPDSHDARCNHAIAREIERELGLERVTGPYDREPGEPRPKRAPEPWEMYRGMKTGLDPRDVEAEVTELFQQSDSGKAFQAALEQHGYMLVQGDRRGFVILDSAGKDHSLARRIDGVNTKELNAFMRDVDRQALPTVEAGKALYQERRVAGLEADRATVSHEINWEESLARAAIEKEKIERQFVEPEPGRGWTPESRFAPPSPQAPPHPQLNQTHPKFWFDDAALEISRDGRLAPDRLTENVSPVFKDLPEAAKIWEAYNRNQHDPNAFAFALGEEGILLAVASKEDAARSREESAAAKQENRFLPTYKEGQVLAIGPSARVYTLNENTTGQPRQEIERFLTKLDRTDLQAIEATQQLMHERAESREAYVQLMGIANPLGRVPRLKLNDRSVLQATLKSAQRGVENTVELTGDVLSSAVPPEIVRPLGKVARETARVAEGIGDAVAGLFAPTLSPEQKLEGEIASHERKIEAEEYVNLSKFTSAVAQVRQQEDERQVIRQRDRDDRER
jgi:hypothetical protein